MDEGKDTSIRLGLIILLVLWVIREDDRSQFIYFHHRFELNSKYGKSVFLYIILVDTPKL
jgi:hypothetical protein